jgi:hypothetical protein
MNGKPQKLNVGNESTVVGNVTGVVGDRCTVVGATDANGNVNLTTPMAVGYKAEAGPGSIAIGTGAKAGVTFEQVAAELVTIRNSMSESQKAAEFQEAIDLVDEAAKAATRHDEATVLKLLRKAGPQALIFVSGVSSSLAASYIFQAMQRR